MAPIFGPQINSYVKGGLLLFLIIILLVILGAFGMTRSDYAFDVGEYVLQPVPFSHEHHVSGLGIDCRYCHNSATVSSFAGMPTTHTCMSCHSQIWTNSPMLAPVRESYEKGVPLSWNRVTNVGDHVYFNHGAHTRRGIQCQTCHGQVERMPLVHKARPLTMEWCLECHRTYQQKEDFTGPHQGVGFMTDCNVCHR